MHGLYYALLHLWIDLVGDSPFAVRLPSGIAIGAASAGVYVLVRRRADRGTAVIAAIMFLLLPRVLFMAIDARSMALATAAATWLTVLLLRLLDAPARRAWWILYVIGLAAATYLFLYVVLLIPVHAVVVLADRRAGRRLRGAGLASFCVAWAGALLIAAPIVVAALRQRDQIAFRAEQQVVTPRAILVGQWFMLDVFAIAAWALVAVACIAAVVHRTDPRGAATGSSCSSRRRGRSSRRLRCARRDRRRLARRTPRGTSSSPRRRIAIAMAIGVTAIPPVDLASRSP